MEGDAVECQVVCVSREELLVVVELPQAPEDDPQKR